MASYDVFVSYSRGDGVQAALLDQWLTEQGLRTFFDRRELGGGQLWLPDLEAAIDAEAEALIILCGPSGLGNTQQYEAQLGLTRKARDPSFPVIPVLLPATPDWRWPRGFLSLQTWVSFAAARDVREEPQALQRLLAAIRREHADAEAVRGLVCPFKGLDAFQEEDAGLFFGREQETEELYSTVVSHRVAAVLGRSGSGKSSLARAGLLPRLRRTTAGAERRDVWESLVLRPGEEPLLALAGALAPALPGEDDATRYLRLRGIAAGLREERADVLAGMLRHRLAQSRLAVDRLLIVVDQGEELFSRPLHLLGNTEGERRFAADADHFISLLLTAATQGVASVVLAMRSDFFDPLQASAFGPMLKDSLVPLRRMGDVRACIEGPANAVGLRFSTGLVDRILNEVGNDESNLPLLQHALKRTWEGRQGSILTGDAYLRSGGVDQAIHHAAQACLESLTSEERAAARRLFLRLVRPGEGTGWVRATAPRPDDPLERAVMERFADPKQRLLFVDVRNGQPVVELAHEALIRGWPSMIAWIAGSQERLQTRAEVLRWRDGFEGEPELLPTGALLQRAVEFLRDPGDVPLDDIRDYISASVSAQALREREEREREAEQVRLTASLAEERAAAAERDATAARRLSGRTRIAAGFLGALFIGAAGLGVHAWRQQLRAEQEAIRAEEQAVLADARRREAEREQARALSSAAEALRQQAIAEGEARRADANLAAAERAASTLVFDLAQGLRNRAGMPADMVREILTLSDRALDALQQATPDEPRVHQLRATALVEMGETLRVAGEVPGALAAFRGAVALMARRMDASATAPPVGALQTMARAHHGVGTMLRAQGDLDGALAAHRIGLDVALRVEASGTTATSREEVATSHSLIAGVLSARGDLVGAIASEQESLTIRRFVLTAAPDDPVKGVAAARSHLRLAPLLRAQGQLSAAVAAFQEARLLLERAVAADPANTTAQRDLARGLSGLGNALRAQGDRSGALAVYRAALPPLERLAASDHGNTEWQRDLALVHNNLAISLRDAGDAGGALAGYRASLAIRERLASSDPTNAEWQRDLSLAHNNLAVLLRAQGDGEAALTSYRASLAIRERLAALAPGSAEWQRDLASAQRNLGMALRALGDPESAVVPLLESRVIFERLAALDPSNLARRNDLAEAHFNLGRVLEATNDPTGAVLAHQLALSLREGLAARDPTNATWQRQALATGLRLGIAMLAAGDCEGAQARAEEATRTSALLAARFPGLASRLEEGISADALIERVRLACAR